MAKYTIGMDFGTLSCRGVLASVDNGDTIAERVFDYPHGVMSESLPDGRKLGQDWALEHPQDYLEAMQYVVSGIMQDSGVDPTDVIGIGLDVTGSTPMPVTKDGTPLCFLEQFRDEPHAYIKLWKHHAAQKYANRINTVANKRGERWLARYGGKISSEWFFPKLWQIYAEAPAVYSAMDHFIEAADWLTWMLTGMPVKNACYAGYKAMWSRCEGYPSEEFFASLDPGLRNVIREKVSLPILPQGACAGKLTDRMAKKLGLRTGISVAVGNSDALANVAAAKISSPGKMLAVMGTSTCHMLLDTHERTVPGICGCVEDGILPGFFGYEAGQNCVGDHFNWFVKNCVPREYYAAADEFGMDIHQYLQMQGDRLVPGESGLLALDWWNGNRSILNDSDLTGMMLGMTLRTRPEEMYRALVEATAFGTRMIIENFEQHGIKIDEFFAMGGIANKSSFVLQIYADIINRKIRVAGSKQGPALASAIFGAVAAGKVNGGWDTISEAADAMGKLKDEIYTPIEMHRQIYDSLYAEFVRCHNYFGRGENDVMKNLKKIKGESLETKPL